ncbi:MAG: hypothetical protein J6X44_01495, partial [Thermoguttaceae bacterium]|nr:hypothetical protein [Thermoguttaceae bacterium]
MKRKCFAILLLLLSVGVAFLGSDVVAQESKLADGDAGNLSGGLARWNAVDFGVTTDDESVDNTAALQNALNAAGEAGGGIVELPSGRFRFDGVLTIPTGVTLQGTYRVPPTVVNKDEKPTGTTLLTYANRGKIDGEPFITLKGSNSALMGVVIVYPEWKQEEVPPVPYPPCVASKDTCNVAVVNCCLLNPYEGINFVLAHRHLIRNVTGYPSWRGIFVDECYDIGHIENVHFWRFGVFYQADNPYCEWVNLYGTAFEFARADWHYVSNTFCFGYGKGYYFSERGHGGANGNFLGIGADSCRRAVLVDQSQKQGLLITNGEFVGRWTSEDSVCVEIGEDNDGTVSLTNCTFWGPVKTCVWSRTKRSRVILNACEFVNWDVVHSLKTKEGVPAVKIDAGRATLVGNSFEQPGIHLLVGEEVAYVTATANQAPGGFRVQGDKSSAKVQLAANELDPLALFPEGKENYCVRLGRPGDERFIRNWYGPEQEDGHSFRWSSDNSFFTLPISEKAKTVSVEIDVDIPTEVLTENADDFGIFISNQKLADFSAGPNRLHLDIVPDRQCLNAEG